MSNISGEKNFLFLFDGATSLEQLPVSVLLGVESYDNSRLAHGSTQVLKGIE